MPYVLALEKQMFGISRFSPAQQVFDHLGLRATVCVFMDMGVCRCTGVQSHNDNELPDVSIAKLKWGFTSYCKAVGLTKDNLPYPTLQSTWNFFEFL